MTTLIALISSGKGSWGHVGRVMNSQDWSKIILFGNAFAKEKFSSEKQFEFFEYDENKSIVELKDQFKDNINVNDVEVAVSIISGSGKEHMALLKAIMEKGLGFRFVALTKDGFVEV